MTALAMLSPMPDFASFTAAVQDGVKDRCTATFGAAFRETRGMSPEDVAARTTELSDLISADSVPVDFAAHAALVAGALVEAGHEAGPAGPATLRRLAATAPELRAFLRALPESGAPDAPLEPGRVEEGQAARITAELGDGGAAVRAWQALDYLGRAALTLLNVEELRDVLRTEPELAEALTTLVTELHEATGRHEPMLRLLRLNEVDTLLVLHRESGRGFRVRPTGVTDSDQLHTLLAGALIGPQGRGLPGTPPDPSVLASFRGQEPPQDDGDVPMMRGAWTLHDATGRLIMGSTHPAPIPEADGERVVVLDPLTMHSRWSAGRAFPMVHADLEVLAELTAEEARLRLDHTAPPRDP
jgi:hypothetical protein